jgi:hypothetical protein
MEGFVRGGKPGTRWSEDAAKALQLRSRIAQGLNVEGDGKVLIRSHVIEASGSSEAWYVPPHLFARCGLAW